MVSAQCCPLLPCAPGTIREMIHKETLTISKKIVSVSGYKTPEIICKFTLKKEAKTYLL